MDIMSRSGAYLNSGTAQRYAFAFPGLGQDTFGRTQKHVDIDKAFIQFAGITAGRASSFFDFYATDLEFINANIVSNVSATNLLAYTATFGGGFSATVSAEDPIFRRNPVFATVSPTAGFGTGTTGFTPTGGAAIALGSLGLLADHRPERGREQLRADRRGPALRMPDFVGALRVDQAWGSAQVMGAVHEIAIGVPGSSGANSQVVVNPIGGPVGAPVNVRYDTTALGFGVGAGIKLNLPQLAPGDQLWLQVAYAQGANSYTGLSNPHGAELIASGPTRPVFSQVDAALTRTGRLELTEATAPTSPSCTTHPGSARRPVRLLGPGQLQRRAAPGPRTGPAPAPSR
jgi:hypothetical protein